MLKRALLVESKKLRQAATFRWLCVETADSLDDIKQLQAQPPSGGCVLKHPKTKQEEIVESSHLQVAVC